MSSPSEFIEELVSETGTRVAGSEGEQAAQAKMEQELSKLGLETERQTFKFTAHSNLVNIIRGFLLAVAGIILAITQDADILSLILLLLAVVLYVLTKLQRSPLTQIVKPLDSDNIIAKFKPVGMNEVKRKCIIIAGADSPTSTLRARAGFSIFYGLANRLLLISNIALLAISLIVILPTPIIVKIVFSVIGVVFAVVSLAIAGLYLSERFLRLSYGVNCNASGLAALKEVGEVLSGNSTRETIVNNSETSTEQASENEPENEHDLSSLVAQVHKAAAEEATEATDAEVSATQSTQATQATQQDLNSADVTAAISKSGNDATIASEQADLGKTNILLSKISSLPSISSDAADNSPHASAEEEVEPELALTSSLQRQADENAQISAELTGDINDLTNPLGDSFDIVAKSRSYALQNEFDILDREVWLVSVGASFADEAGLHALLDSNKKDVKGAYLINLLGVGAGTLSYTLAEGEGRPLRNNKRLINAISKTAEKLGVNIFPFSLPFSTIANLAAKTHFKAVSIIGLGNHLPVAYRYHDNDATIISDEQIRQAADIALGTIKTV